MRSRPKPSEAIQVASSHLITTCATLAAIILFVVLGVRVVPESFSSAVPPSSGLIAAFLLNIAIILFGWRRAKELAQAMAAVAHAEQEAHRNAYVDCVTGLANRRALVKALGEKLDAKKSGAIALFDLDFFKKVNDLHGHSAGDDLLNHVGKLLGEIAPKGSLIARLGGDEFAVLMHVREHSEAVAVAEQILESLTRPVMFGGQELVVGASIGIADSSAEESIRQRVADADIPAAAAELLRAADAAMYAAKRSGGQRIVEKPASQSLGGSPTVSFRDVA